MAEAGFSQVQYRSPVHERFQLPSVGLEQNLSMPNFLTGPLQLWRTPWEGNLAKAVVLRRRRRN
jgi:hypothetical protein